MAMVMNACDRCPFSGRMNLERCPQFEAEAYRAVDWFGNPLPAITTCAHLDVGGEPGPVGPWYPRCRAGVPSTLSQASPVSAP